MAEQGQQGAERAKRRGAVQGGSLQMNNGETTAFTGLQAAGTIHFHEWIREPNPGAQEGT